MGVGARAFGKKRSAHRPATRYVTIINCPLSPQRRDGGVRARPGRGPRGGVPYAGAGAGPGGAAAGRGGAGGGAGRGPGARQAGGRGRGGGGWGWQAQLLRCAAAGGLGRRCQTAALLEKTFLVLSTKHSESVCPADHFASLRPGLLPLRLRGPRGGRVPAARGVRHARGAAVGAAAARGRPGRRGGQAGGEGQAAGTDDRAERGAEGQGRGEGPRPRHTTRHASHFPRSPSLRSHHLTATHSPNPAPLPPSRTWTRAASRRPSWARSAPT